MQPLENKVVVEIIFADDWQKIAQERDSVAHRYAIERFPELNIPEEEKIQRIKRRFIRREASRNLKTLKPRIL